MNGANGVFGSISENNPYWMKIRQPEEDKVQGQSAGAYMACNDIGNFLNGTKTYA